MQTEQIVALLITERDRLSRAIEALQGPARRRGRPPGSAKKTAAPVTADAPTAPKKRKLTAAGRKAIADATRRRWAAVKAAKATPKDTTPKVSVATAVAKPASKKRRISAAARKAMGDAARRRWAAAKAKAAPTAKKDATKAA